MRPKSFQQYQNSSQNYIISIPNEREKKFISHPWKSLMFQNIAPDTDDSTPKISSQLYRFLAYPNINQNEREAKVSISGIHL